MLNVFKILLKINCKIKSFYFNKILSNSINKPKYYGSDIEFVCPENIELGKRVAFNNKLYINATYPIMIGNDVAVSEGVKLITVTLDYRVNPMNTVRVGGSISIGNNVQIGAGSIILPNVSIGNNVVIGAGSVVTKSIESNCIVVGNPARLLKKI